VVLEEQLGLIVQVWVVGHLGLQLVAQILQDVVIGHLRQAGRAAVGDAQKL